MTVAFFLISVFYLNGVSTDRVVLEKPIMIVLGSHELVKHDSRFHRSNDQQTRHDARSAVKVEIIGL